jgi:hypothetical protein
MDIDEDIGLFLSSIERWHFVFSIHVCAKIYQAVPVCSSRYL